MGITIIEARKALGEAHDMGVELGRELGMNDGRAEGIEAFFSALDIALRHHDTIDGIRAWRDAAYETWKAACR